MSENAKKEFTVDGIGDEPQNETHHSPASIIHLFLLPWREETLAVVIFYNHLGLHCPHVLLSMLVGCDGHVLL